MLEGVICLLILALFFVGVTRLGMTAIAEQKAQDAVDYAPWAEALGVPAMEPKAEVETEFLGYRATYDHKHGEHKSYRVDVGDDF